IEHSVLGSATAPIGAVTVTADSTADIDALVLAAGVGALGIGISVARNFIGYARADLTADHLSTDHVDQLTTGTTVEVASGPRTGDVYEYLGPDTRARFDFDTANLPDDPAAVLTGTRVLHNGVVY